jgi:hypothetical protein
MLVRGRLQDFDIVGAVELVKLIRVADNEIYRAPCGTRRAALQEHLHVAQIDTRDGRRLAPSEAEREAEFVGIEVNGGGDVANREAWVVTVAIDLWDPGHVGELHSDVRSTRRPRASTHSPSYEICTTLQTAVALACPRSPRARFTAAVDLTCEIDRAGDVLNC